MMPTVSDAELLSITPGQAFARDLLETLRAEAGAANVPARGLQQALAVAAVAAGGATFYGILRLHRRGAAA